MANGIRQATLEDGGFLVDCMQAMLADMQSYGGQRLVEPGAVRQWLWNYIDSWLSQKEHLFVVAAAKEGGNHLVGMAEAYLTYPDEVFMPVRRLHIAALYVRPDCRGEGLGGSLLEAAMQWGRENGCAEVELNVLAGNPARSLYQRMGFEVFELQQRMKL